MRLSVSEGKKIALECRCADCRPQLQKTSIMRDGAAPQEGGWKLAIQHFQALVLSPDSGPGEGTSVCSRGLNTQSLISSVCIAECLYAPRLPAVPASPFACLTNSPQRRARAAQHTQTEANICLLFQSVSFNGGARTAHEKHRAPVSARSYWLRAAQVEGYKVPPRHPPQPPSLGGRAHGHGSEPASRPGNRLHNKAED